MDDLALLRWLERPVWPVARVELERRDRLFDRRSLAAVLLRGLRGAEELPAGRERAELLVAIVARLRPADRPQTLNRALDSALSLETISGLERRELLKAIFEKWKAIAFAGLETRARVTQTLKTLGKNRRGCSTTWAPSCR